MPRSLPDSRPAKKIARRGPATRSSTSDQAILTLRGNGGSYTVKEVDLADPSNALAYCRAAAEQKRRVVVGIPLGKKLLRPDVRCLLLNIGAIKGPPVSYRVNTSKYGDLLKVLLDLTIDPQDVSQCHQHLSACLEVAAAVHPDSLELACGIILDTFRAAGVRGLQIRAVVKKAVSLTGGKARDHVTPRQASDLYMAHRREILDLDENALCVLHQDDEFSVYQGTHWQRVADGEMRAELTKFFQYNVGVEVTKSFLENVLINLRGLCYLPGDQSSQVRYVDSLNPPRTRPAFAISLQNGLLVPAQSGIFDGQLKQIPHDSRYLVRSCLPFEFDSEAQCPIWRQTLDEILPRREAGDHRQEVLQELMGLSLMPQAARLETAGILVGEGANGKSTILSVHEAILGPENTAHIPLDQLGGEFRLDELRGKHANIAGDMNRMERVAEGLLKQIISGDPVSVNRKFKSPITLRMFCVFLFATNELPQFLDPTKGIWRRFRIIPFLESFEGAKRDVRRIEKLKEELPGIFNLLLKALQRLLAAGAFTDCIVCDRALVEHRLQSDPVLEFLDECTFTAPTAEVGRRELYSAYREFCEANGRKPHGEQEFGKRLRRHRKVEEGGRGRDRKADGSVSRVRRYKGIALGSVIETTPPKHKEKLR